MAREPYENEDTGNEYQFHDEQQSSGAAEYNYVEEPQPASSPPKPKLKPKPIIIIVIAIIVVFIIFKIVSSMFGKHETPAPASVAPISTQTVQQPATQMANIPNLADTINQLQASNQDLATKIQQQQFQDQTNFMTMQENINNVNTQIQQVASKVDALSTAFYQQQEMERKAAYAKTQAVARAAAALRQQKSYFVDAVIPGRAWLKGADGSTVTVAVGTVLPGYGAVLSINPYSGEVKTSSGIIPYATSAD